MAVLQQDFTLFLFVFKIFKPIWSNISSDNHFIISGLEWNGGGLFFLVRAGIAPSFPRINSVNLPLKEKSAFLFGVELEHDSAYFVTDAWRDCHS